MTFLNKLPQRARLGKIFARYLLVIAISKCQTCQHTLFFGGIWQVGKLRERKKKEKKTQVTVVPKMSTDHLTVFPFTKPYTLVLAIHKSRQFLFSYLRSPIPINHTLL